MPNKELQSKNKKGNNKMTLNEYKRTRKKNLTEKLNLNMYDDCWVECRDGEPTFCYSTLEDCRAGIISSGRGDWYYGDGRVHKYTIKRWENGKLYDVDSKTNEVIYESLRNRRKLKEEHIADKIKAGQDKKEMTRRAIKTLRNLGGKSKDLEKEFKDKYGHSVDENLKEDFWWEEEEGFFTRDDLDEFQAELEDEIPNVIFRKTYLEPGNSLEVDWEYEGYEETTKVRVDMRRIRYPRDLIRKYAPTVAGMIKNSCAEIDRELNESLRSRRYLKEDYDSLIDLAEEMINYLNKNGVSWVDLYTVNDDGPLSSITLEIDGDWKHDHLRANYLLQQKYGDRIKSIQDYSLEDTGSDYGKEAHVIRLK